jgi:hypothetical protein
MHFRYLHVWSPAMHQAWCCCQLLSQTRCFILRILLQTLKEVSELTKYYCRSMYIGYQRLAKPFLEAHKIGRDAHDQRGQAINPQRQRNLDIVSVRTLQPAWQQMCTHACQEHTRQFACGFWCCSDLSNTATTPHCTEHSPCTQSCALFLWTTAGVPACASASTGRLLRSQCCEQAKHRAGCSAHHVHA